MENLSDSENLTQRIGFWLLHSSAYVSGGRIDDWFKHGGERYDIKISRGEIVRVRKREQYIKRSGASGRKYYRYRTIYGEKRQEIIDAFTQQRKRGAA